MDKQIDWNGFLKLAVESYPNEVAGFLFTDKPYADDEKWTIMPVKNIAEDKQNRWIPDKKDMLKGKQQAKKLGLIKIGNVHTHPWTPEIAKEFGDTYEGQQEACMPSDVDLGYARKFNDFVRIILLTNDKGILQFYIHDNFGRKIPIEHLVEGNPDD